MSVSQNPRWIAIQQLGAVVDGRSLDRLGMTTPAELSDQDRAFAAELSYGLCRWYRQLHAIVAARLHRPMRERDRDVHFVLMLGVYQLLHAGTPAHAAVSTSVELVRQLDKPWAAKLVNAVLRGVQRESKDADSRLARQLEDDWSIRFAQPKWLLKALRKAWPDQLESLLQALQQRAPMTLRLDIRRTSREDYLQQLSAQGIAASSLDEVPCAVLLERPVSVQQLPGFQQGLVSVQDAGAQLAGLLLDVQPGQRILDACAAPGGKTGHILELAEQLDLTAVDVDAKRLQRVHDNLQRLQRHAKVQLADAAKPPAAWHQQPFDRILLDAPCSATGVMRRHPDIRLLRRASDIPVLVQHQAEMLDALWQCLRIGGKMLYATCSVLPDENYLQIEAFLQRTPDARVPAMPEHWGQACRYGRQILPGEKTMDGFYYAILEKIDA